jgi:hypothetical protein
MYEWYCVHRFGRKNAPTAYQMKYCARGKRYALLEIFFLSYCA